MNLFIFKIVELGILLFEWILHLPHKAIRLLQQVHPFRVSHINNPESLRVSHFHVDFQHALRFAGGIL